MGYTIEEIDILIDSYEEQLSEARFDRACGRQIHVLDIDCEILQLQQSINELEYLRKLTEYFLENELLHYY